MAKSADAVRAQRLAWWREARFGLFIHWNPSSVIGQEISWSRVGHPFDYAAREIVPTAEYDALYRRFDPQQFDADQWMALAKAAGMRYVVFTTKHHDGFSMWPTKLSDYNITATPFKRDICGELADAAHRHGIKLGWYYSTRDWYHPDYLKNDNAAYNDFYHGQLRELLTNYGKVDLLWFDHVCGQWGDYRFNDLFAMIYALQPDILVNDRAAKFVFQPADAPSPEIARLVAGDFDTPEQRIGAFQHTRPWESCITITACADGGGWSYRPDGRTRDLDECRRLLVDCVAGDGNLLLNVGPLPTGEIAADQQAVLRQLGGWLAQNGESIYGTRSGPFRNGAWGGATYRDNMVYLHVVRPRAGALRFPPLRAKVNHAAVLNSNTITYGQTATGITLELPATHRDTTDIVLKLELDAPATDEFVAGQPLEVDMP